MIKVIVFNLMKLMKKKGYVDKNGVVLYRKAARDAKCSHSTLWKLANQDKLKKPFNPSLQMLNQLCRFFGVKKLDQLVEYKKD